MESGIPLQKYKATQYSGVITDAEPMTEFDIDLYFALVEKMTVHDRGRVILSLLEGTELTQSIGLIYTIDDENIYIVHCRGQEKEGWSFMKRRPLSYFI